MEPAREEIVVGASRNCKPAARVLETSRKSSVSVVEIRCLQSITKQSELHLGASARPRADGRTVEKTDSTQTDERVGRSDVCDGWA